MRFVLAATTTLSLLIPWTASAQLVGTADSVAGSSFTVSVSPQYPVPGGRATLSLLSDTLDLANATVSITVGGKSVYQGSSQPTAITLGKAGSVTTVVVKVSSNGASYSQTVSIQPQDVAVVAEPISSAPPLYPGKALVPLSGDVRVVAMANLRSASGKSLDPSALSYAWTIDDTQIANSSGIGKDAIIVAAPLQYRARDVSVVVTSQDGSLVGGDALTLTPVDATLRVYENDPLLGIRYDHAISDSFTIPGAETTFFAAPFSLPTTQGVPLVQWFLNGSAAQTGNSITVRPTGSGQGSASL
jgi:hypothetical protein